MVALVVFYPDSRLDLSQHGRLCAVSFETASQDTQTLNLLQNMSKFYARQVVSLRNEQQSQNLLLKVDLPSTIRNNKFIMQGEKLKTSAKLRVFHLCIKYIINVVKALIYEVRVLFLIFRHLKNSAAFFL